MRLGLLVVVLMITSGCASQPEKSVQAALPLQDALFPQAHLQQIETPDEIFYLSPQARQRMQTMRLKSGTKQKLLNKLLAVMFHDQDINLRYVGSANTTAMETYHSGDANCLSLSILAYALAEEVGLLPQFQQVQIPELWVRRDGYSLLNGHVNVRLTLLDAQEALRTHYIREREVVVDFDPYVARQQFDTQDVDKARILAMFYNNRGADELVGGNLDLAYQYFKAAAQHDSQFMPIWSNLGALYRMVGNYALAEKVYKSGLTIAPEDGTLLENLAVLYETTGQTDQAQRILEALYQRRQSNPYFHYIRGEEALANRQFEAAKHHFRRAIRLNRDIHEFYFAMARVFAHQGDKEQTQQWLIRAQSRAKAPDVSLGYQNKLDLLGAR